MPAASTAIGVTGMHRSGTSLVMRCLNLMGVVLAKDGDAGRLLPPGEDNPAGFWEHNGIVALQESLLRELRNAQGAARWPDRPWADPRPLPRGWEDAPVTARHAEHLVRLCRDEFAAAEVWGFKDPRTALLVPLWRRVCGSLSARPRLVLVVRHPLESVASLSLREGFGAEHGLRLWLLYNTEAIRATQACNRVAVDYGEMLAGGPEQVRRLAAALSLRCSDAALSAASAAIRVDLRHHVRGPRLGWASVSAGDPPAPLYTELAELLYEGLRAAAGPLADWTAAARAAARCHEVLLRAPQDGPCEARLPGGPAHAGDRSPSAPPVLDPIPPHGSSASGSAGAPRARPLAAGPSAAAPPASGVL